MKKILWVFIIILIAIIIGGIFIFYNIFSHNRYDLKNITEFQKQNMILFLNCEEISDEIELIEMQIPKAYKDIYYEIYLKTTNNKVREYISKAETDLYNIDVKELKKNNYCCVINRKDSKSIELLESIANRNVINNPKNEISNGTIIKNNEPQDITQKINDNQVVHLGIINNIDDKYIYYSDSDSKNFYFKKELFSYINGRTCKNITLSDVNIGDYIHPFEKQIHVFRNLTGEELNQELLYNFTLTNDERIMYVNSIGIEQINIIDEDTAIVKISYGDIIGGDLTGEKFNTIVEFNSNTKYISKGNNINSFKDLEYAKGNINSIILEKDSINKKSIPIVVEFESSDN